MTVNDKFALLHSIHNSWQHWRQDDSRARFTTAVVGLQQLWSEATLAVTTAVV